MKSFRDLLFSGIRAVTKSSLTQFMTPDDITHVTSAQKEGSCGCMDLEGLAEQAELCNHPRALRLAAAFRKSCGASRLAGISEQSSYSPDRHSITCKNFPGCQKSLVYQSPLLQFTWTNVPFKLCCFQIVSPHTCVHTASETSVLQLCSWKLESFSPKCGAKGVMYCLGWV